MRAAIGVLATMALLSAGCAADVNNAPSSPREASEPPAKPDSHGAGEPQRTATATDSLWGAWTVVASRDAAGRSLHVALPPAGADRDQDGSPPIRMIFGNGEVSATSQCVSMGPFGYRQTATGTEPAPLPERPPSYVDQPVPMCARGLSEAESLVAPVLESRTAVRVVADGVEIASDKGALVLRRQGIVANPGGWSPPPRVPPPWGAWRVVRIDGRAVPADRPIHLAIGGIGLHYSSGCVAGSAWLKRDEPIGSIVPDGVKPIVVCDRGRYVEEERMDRLLSERSRARMDASGAITLDLARGGRIEGEPLD